MQDLKPSPPQDLEAEFDSKSSPHENPEAKSDDLARFDKSLQELKDLRSQLHYAADYCEMTFSKAKQKKMVMENTKEYLCRAMVTVVDHLGCVSANLECRLSGNNEFSETELRIDCLKQRLLTCQKYSQNLALTKLSWSANFPRHHSRYTSPPIPSLENSDGVLRDVDDSVGSKTTPMYKLDADEEMPLFPYTFARKSALDRLFESHNGVKKLGTNSASGFGLSTVLPVHEDLSVLPKHRNPSFHFQDTKVLGRNERNRRSLYIPWRNK